MASAFPELEPVLEHQGHRPDGLLEILNQAQALEGWLSPDLLNHLASVLELPSSRILGTASFYHLFRLQPPPRHTCLVCTGTACHVKGAQALETALRDALGTNPDAGVELGAVRCVGTCGAAPLVVVDGEIWPRMDAPTLLRRWQPWLQQQNQKQNQPPQDTGP